MYARQNVCLKLKIEFKQWKTDKDGKKLLNAENKHIREKRDGLFTADSVRSLRVHGPDVRMEFIDKNIRKVHAIPLADIISINIMPEKAEKKSLPEPATSSSTKNEDK